MNHSGDAQFPLSEVRRLEANRLPCPVCGHPTGDCVPDDFQAPRPNPMLLGQISQVKTSGEIEEKVLVEEDVFGDRQITPFTRARVLLARKGSYVTVEKAKELGIL